MLLISFSGSTYRDGDGHVDTDLAGLNLALESTCCRTGSSEDGGAVSILIRVDEIDGLVECLYIEADENRTEDLLRVALHVRLDVGNDGRANLFIG